ncbi:MAG: hypothetical protein A4E43_00035 [Methanosaeta sp. PtaB.Bin005]|nr:MAG: hypothetical protein A4E43_00035 [Methanosaeta sp. PtaB.Bin005]
MSGTLQAKHDEDDEINFPAEPTPFFRFCLKTAIFLESCTRDYAPCRSTNERAGAVIKISRTTTLVICFKSGPSCVI